MYDKLYTTRLVMNLQGGDRSQCSLTCRLGGTINRSYHMLCLFCDSIKLVYYKLDINI